MTARYGIENTCSESISDFTIYGTREPAACSRTVLTSASSS
jgi:hypothetical protein